jgi:hypothetical protein
MCLSCENPVARVKRIFEMQKNDAVNGEQGSVNSISKSIQGGIKKRSIIRVKMLIFVRSPRNIYAFVT